MAFSPSGLRLLVAAALVFLAADARADDDARPSYLAGYADDAEYAEQIEALREIDLVRVRSIGKSIGERPIWLVTVGRGEVDAKPAIAVVGSVDGTHLLGSELAVRMAEQLARQAADDEAISKLLDRYTFYFIPRADPDTAQKCLTKPFRQPQGNDRQTDDDRDFEFGEDPADDLNGDGIITQMRVDDSTGDYIVDTDDERVLVAADRNKNEIGRYRLLTEGKDDDGDEAFNEDGSGGVAPNHNFPQQYKPLQPHTGDHAASEPETRAVIDFFFDHPNVAIVFSFSLEDNLFHPWKSSQDKERIRKTIFPSDAAAVERIVGDYKKLHGGSDSPTPPDAHGSFNHWAYFHYGRWSLSARGWWVPKVADKEEAKPADEAEPKTDKPAAEKADEKDDKKPADDKRSADHRNLLRWLDREKIDGFVEWQPVEHPDFPGKTVEVGGFKPLVGLNPPASQFDDLAEKHGDFLTKLAGYLPEIAIIEAEAKPLGAGVYRITATVQNRGYLPTMPEMGSTNKQPQTLQIAINLPKDAELLQGHPRERLPRLEGAGGKAEQTWLVRFKGDPPDEIKIRAWSPAVGEANTKVVLFPL